MSRREPGPGRGPAFDRFLVRATAAALGPALSGSRVQKIFEPEHATLVLHLHPGADDPPLVLKARGQGFAARAAAGLANPLEPSPFCMLLRKHLEMGIVEGLEQVGEDRILALAVRVRDAEGVQGTWKVVLELLGTKTNLHLVDPAGRVVASRKAYPADRDRFGPGRLYRPPPPPPGEARLPPRIAALVHDVEGRSPGLGRELEAALLAPDAGRAGPFCQADGPAGSYALVGAGPALEAAGYRLRAFPSLDALVAAVFVAGAADEREERDRAACARILDEVGARLERQLARNAEGLEECGRADEIRGLGELIKQNLGRIPTGATRFTATGYWSGEPKPVEIELDPRLKPKANMERYFDRAKRLRLKEPILARKRRHLEREREHLAELRARLADPGASLGALREDLKLLGVDEDRPRPGKPREEKKGLRSFISGDGLRILVGRSNEENDFLVKKAGKKGDAWLHAEGVPGAHVLVKLPPGAERPPPRTLRDAAQLALHFSKSRYAVKGRVILSRIGEVKRPPGAPPGVVTLGRHETVAVETDPDVVHRLAPRLSNVPGSDR